MLFPEPHSEDNLHIIVQCPREYTTDSLVAVKHADSTPIQVGDSVGDSTTQNIS